MKHEREFLLSVADIGFHARWAHSRACFFKDPCFDSFLLRAAPDIENACRTLVHRTEVDIRYRRGELLPKSVRAKKTLEIPRHWALYTTDERYYLERFYPPTNRRMSVSVIEKDLSRATFHPERERYWSVRYFVQPLIRYLLINVLALKDGIMLHGSAVKIGGRALIFSGRSGSGKTTISELFKAAGIKVLTDESIALRMREGRLHAYGTPWPGGGRMAASDSAPVGAICFISHGLENALRKTDAKQAAKNILHQAVVQTWDPASIGRIFDTVNTIASRTPCFEMPFVNDENVVKFVMKNLVT